MSEAFIKFNSITYAYLAKDTLLKYSIRSYIRKNSSPNRKPGCNYALFTDTDIKKAYEILERENIKNLGIERSGMR